MNVYFTFNIVQKYQNLKAHIGEVMVSMFTSGEIDRGTSTAGVKPRTIKYVFTASPLSMQH